MERKEVANDGETEAVYIRQLGRRERRFFKPELLDAMNGTYGAGG